MRSIKIQPALVNYTHYNWICRYNMQIWCMCLLVGHGSGQATKGVIGVGQPGMGCQVEQSPGTAYTVLWQERLSGVGNCMQRIYHVCEYFEVLVMLYTCLTLILSTSPPGVYVASVLLWGQHPLCRGYMWNKIILKSFQCFVSHVATSETEIKLFQPLKEF